MDYFFMNECIFKLLIKNQKDFILKLLESINIYIEDYDLFEIETKNNIKVDILLFSNNKVINIQLNKNKKSLTRNKIYLECLKSILPDYEIIQININLFKIKSTYKNIYNYHDENEYIQFITNKNIYEFKTKNSYILKTLKYIKKIDLNSFKNQILKEHKIKERVDNLIKY